MLSKQKKISVYLLFKLISTVYESTHEEICEKNKICFFLKIYFLKFVL